MVNFRLEQRKIHFVGELNHGATVQAKAHKKKKHTHTNRYRIDILERETNTKIHTKLTLFP